MESKKSKILWQPTFEPTAVQGLTRQVLYQGFVQLQRLCLKFPLFEGGFSAVLDREVAVRPPAVAVLLYDPDTQQVVMIEQFRAGACHMGHNPWLLETVAGVIEAGQSPTEAAIREVQEETGLQVLALKFLYRYLPSPAILSEEVFLYCAKVRAPLVGGIHGLPEESENIKVHIFSLTEALQLCEQGSIVSAPALLALQWLAMNHATVSFAE